MLVIMFIGGVVLLLLAGAAWGAWGIYDAWKLTGNGLKATAVVTRLDPYSTKHGIRHHPIVTFTTNKNIEVKIMLTEHCKAEMGHKVELLYDPDQPDKRFRVNTPASLWYAPALLIVITLVIAYPFWRELRKMLIAGQLIKDTRPAKVVKKSSLPPIAELNRRGTLPDSAKIPEKGQNAIKYGQKKL